MNLYLKHDETTFFRPSVGAWLLSSKWQIKHRHQYQQNWPDKEEGKLYSRCKMRTKLGDRRFRVFGVLGSWGLFGVLGS